MKRKWIPIGAAVCAALAAAVYALTPAPILRQPETALLYRVEQVLSTGERLETRDFTGQLDPEEVLDLLSEHSRSRVPRSFAPTKFTPGQLELSVLDGGRPCYILLGSDGGKLFVCYESSNWGGYVIRDGAGLLEELTALLPGG